MEPKDIIREENKVYSRTPLLTDATLSYCPGCGHGTVHRIIMEVVEEMGIQEDCIGIAPVGCAVLARFEQSHLLSRTCVRDQHLCHPVPIEWLSCRA